MIIINDTFYIMNPTEVSRVRASSQKIIIWFKGGGWSDVSSKTPKEDAYRLVRLIQSDIRAVDSSDGYIFDTDPPDF